MNKLAWLLLTLISGCTHKEKTAPPAPPSLSEKAALYAELVSGIQSSDGFIGVSECDSLLWSGLYSVVAMDSVDLEAAEVEPGHWLRRPAKEGPCERPLSRDMIRGVLWWAWSHGRPDALERLWARIEDDGGFVDDGADSLVTPQFAGLIARTMKATGAHCSGACGLAAFTPNRWPKDYGFEAHLQGLDAALEALSTGNVESGAIGPISDTWGRNPANPFFAALVYRLTGSPEAAALAEGALKDETHWPNDRLPSGDVVCDMWPMQRESGADWDPCPNWDPETRTPDYREAGAAWLFAHWLLTKAEIVP